MFILSAISRAPFQNFFGVGWRREVRFSLRGTTISFEFVVHSQEANVSILRKSEEVILDFKQILSVMSSIEQELKSKALCNFTFIFLNLTCDDRYIMKCQIP